ncbi:hypothetical protein [Amaricoccus sp. W119]|uniref:hypothetical protein n=1 Tax=Amaricoccus sp. W119 TaxID=3391833 RepID=UPI0039A6D1F1
MAFNANLLYSLRMRLTLLLKEAPKSAETADLLRSYRYRLGESAEAIVIEAEAALVKAKAEAERLRAEAAALPPDFEGEVPTIVADYATFGSPSGSTPPSKGCSIPQPRPRDVLYPDCGQTIYHYYTVGNHHGR